MLSYKDSISYGVAVALALLAWWLDVTAIRIALGIAAATFLLWPILHTRFRMTLPLTLGVVCFGGLIAGLVWQLVAYGLPWAQPAKTRFPEAREESLDYSISVSCSWSKPPSHYREDRSLAIVDFQGVPETSPTDFSQRVGALFYTIRSSDPFKASEHHAPGWYRCDVSNLGTVPVRDLQMQFPVIFSRAIVSPNETRSGEPLAAGVSPSPSFDLAAGSSDYFYFSNASPSFVRVTIPETATLHTGADNASHTVRLVRRGELGPSFFLNPSKNPLNDLPGSKKSAAEKR